MRSRDGHYLEFKSKKMSAPPFFLHFYLDETNCVLNRAIKPSPAQISLHNPIEVRIKKIVDVSIQFNHRI